MSIHDVAAYITQHFKSGVSPMKLQKLAFYSQGWNLALRGQPLFDEPFEAWINGPVCYELFQYHKGEWNLTSWPAGDASKLTPKDRIVVEAVLRNFGALSGQDLSRLTHEPGSPWSIVREREGLEPNERTRAEIPHDLMDNFFSN